MTECPDWWVRPRTVSIVVDNDSWILPYANELVDWLNASGDDAVLCRSYDDVRSGVAAFFLGCIGIAGRQVLSKNAYNLVVHESDLPKGRGFAPVTWAILGGTNEITVCLIEASPDEPDAGKVYARKRMRFEGHELHEAIRTRQGRVTVEMCREFMSSPTPLSGVDQVGVATFNARRTPTDSRLDPHGTIAEQFDLLRVVDNERYPAFFELRGRRYVLRIDDGGPASDESPS